MAVGKYSRECAVMSSLDKARAAAQNTRRSTAAAGARPRAPSRLEAGEYSDSAGEVFPQDSVSNAPHRKSNSTSQRNSRLKRDSYERRSENTRTIVTETVRTRVRSPAKTAVGHGSNGYATASGDRSAPKERRAVDHGGSRQKKVNEPPRKFDWCW